jgi:hypothetical protein
MKTALIIQSYAGANATVARHWPYYKRSGFELFGVGRTNTRCEWPEPIPTKDIGEDSYINGDNLPRRLVDTFRWFIEDPIFKDFTHAMVIEYDTIFLRPPPDDTEIVLAAHRAGPNIPPMKSDGFWHNPWWLSKMAAMLFMTEGKLLLDRGENEMGHPDFFFGLVWQFVTKKFIEFKPSHLEGTYSRNSLDIPADRIQARDLIRAGAVWAVHGVKTQAQLEEILS